ncbi:NAD(P)-dependent alcohol dehydrogenase [candidate division KSB1 bacterium]|nr:NAD(P)-dependent alcohol dehydrogenase [candidate division KSB1 bacterium]
MNKINDAEFKDRPIPEPGPNDAVVKTTLALVCTSDVHTLAGGLGELKDVGLGHEAVGTVYKLGKAVEGFKVGERVAVNAVTPCYRCGDCQRGFTSQCKGPLGGFKFVGQKDGNLAEYFHVNDAEANLARIPDGVSDEAAAYATDMVSTGFVAAENADIKLGDSVVIIGQGPVGLMATAGARLLGAGLIIVVDEFEHRFKLAKEYGADVWINYKVQNVVDEVMKLTGGKGANAAIEAVGTQVTFETCFKVTRPGGTISNIGYHSEGEYLKIPRVEWGMGMAQKTIRSHLCPGGAERMGRLLTLIKNGRVDPTKMTTHHFKFADVPKALKMMETKEDNMIKPVIHFD